MPSLKKREHNDRKDDVLNEHEDEECSYHSDCCTVVVGGFRNEDTQTLLSFLVCLVFCLEQTPNLNQVLVFLIALLVFKMSLFLLEPFYLNIKYKAGNLGLKFFTNTELGNIFNLNLRISLEDSN